VVLEGLSSIDEDDRNLVVKLAAEFCVGVDVDFVPGESAAAGELGEALFDDFAEMTSFAGIHHNVARLWHARGF
jgi:hypothetical protein